MKKILVAEDHVSLLIGLNAALKKSGYEVIAASIAEAKRVVLTRHFI